MSRKKRLRKKQRQKTEARAACLLCVQSVFTLCSGLMTVLVLRLLTNSSSVRKLHLCMWVCCYCCLGGYEPIFHFFRVCFCFSACSCTNSPPSIFFSALTFPNFSPQLLFYFQVFLHLYLIMGVQRIDHFRDYSCFLENGRFRCFITN